MHPRHSTCLSFVVTCATNQRHSVYASDNQHFDDVDVSSDSGWPTCATNAKVESYFRSVKHGRLAGRLRVRPRYFLVAELTNIMGKMNEMKLPIQSHRKRRRVGEGRDAEEVWKRRRQSTTAYSTKKKATEWLSSLQTLTCDILNDNDDDRDD